MANLTRRDLLCAGLTLSATTLAGNSTLGGPLAPVAAPPETTSAGAPSAAGQGAEIHFDVRGAGLKPEVSGPLAKWGAKGPGGVMTANDCYLEKDGRPLPIVAGEIHPQRVPPEEWEDAILQMKAAGLNTLSIYVFWSRFARQAGQFDFTGRNDIRRFVKLCQSHGMMAIMRIGPFCNAEFLVGGLPVWLYGMPTTERSNDPLYLKLVGRYYSALGEQLKDLVWDQGGPIVIVQIENELSVAPVNWTLPFVYAASASGHMGPTGEAFTEHYRRLHELAVAAGLNAPFFSVTGWGASDPYPIDVVMPTFGGYMELSPPGPDNSGLTLFTYEGHAYDGKVPVGFIELGYGSPARTDFRPRPPADCGYCTTLTRLGASRSLMIGYYMFRGGSNPVEGNSGWSIAYSSLPLVSYDFWAPIGEYGEWRDSLYRARPFNLFLQNYADELARAEPRDPAQPVTAADDDRPRAEARMDGGRGFVFLSNYGNVHLLSERKDFHIELETGQGTIRIPQALSVDLPSGAMGVWPVNLDLGAGVTLVSATAQPVCHFVTDRTFWHIFSQISTVPAEFAFAPKTVSRIDPGTHGQSITATAGATVVRMEPGRDSVLEAVAGDGRKVRLLLLSQDDAGRLAQLGSATDPLLALSEAIVTRSGNTLSVVSRRLADLSVSLFPAQDLPSSVVGYEVSSGKDGIFHRVSFSGASRDVRASVSHLSPDRALVRLPATAFDGLDNIFLDINYIGDVCRLFDADTGIIAGDNLNNGIPWSVGLKRFAKALASGGLLVRIEPEMVGGNTVQLSGGMTLKPDQRLRGARPLLNSLTFSPRYGVHFVATPGK